MNDSDMDISNRDDLRPKKRSLVWQFFEKLSRERVRCLLCQHEQNYQGTTGNILRHLKARHELDVTLRGQQDPQNQQRIRDLGGQTSTPIKMEIKIERKPRQQYKQQRKPSESDESVVDPYGDADNDEVTFGSPNVTYEDMTELKEDYIEDFHQPLDRKAKLEEERIIAETHYFREKAAYFRFQRHLIALQAKKIKMEIEQMSLNNKVI